MINKNERTNKSKKRNHRNKRKLRTTKGNERKGRK